jgi:hypothetical protein
MYVCIVAEHFWYICLLGRVIAGHRYPYTFKLATYIQEQLVTGR